MVLKNLRRIAGVVMLAAFILIFVRFDSFGGLANAAFITQFSLSAAGPFLWSALLIIASILLLTALAGRVYCSILCPLGLIQDAIIRVKRLFTKASFGQLPGLSLLHYLLAGSVIGLASAGILLPLSLIEPFALAGRLLADLVQPLATMIFKFIAGIMGGGVGWFGQASLKAFDSFNTTLVAASLILLSFLCLIWGRIYCNSICPVGALLRLIAKHSRLRVSIDANKCVSCGSCAKVCKAGCIDTREKLVDHSRCIACFNCLDTCKFSAIGYQLTQGSAMKQCGIFSPGRRAFAGGVAATAAAWLLPRQLLPATEPLMAILPPGAGNQALFTARCISCHLCVAACPSAIIRPASRQPGLLSIQQPSLSFEHGMCEQNCNLCSQICPVMAIRPIISEQKRFLKIGEVFYDKSICVVETNGTDCGACAEHCPTQAVKMVPYRNNLMIPQTDPSICIGCGSCEHICPVRPRRAIVVNPIKEQTFITMPEQEKLPEKAENEFPF